MRPEPSWLFTAPGARAVMDKSCKGKGTAAGSNKHKADRGNAKQDHSPSITLDDEMLLWSNCKT